MGVILDTGSRFPPVTWVDADQRDGTATLIFRHAGRGPRRRSQSDTDAFAVGETQILG